MADLSSQHDGHDDNVRGATNRVFSEKILHIAVFQYFESLNVHSDYSWNSF